MNYLTQINAFYRLLPNNPLSSNAQCLYNYLLNKNNELGWVKEFTVSNMIVCGFTSLSRQALDRARNELKTKGYIDYKKGISNQAGKYLIVSFDTQDNTQNNTQSNTQDDTQGGHTVSTLNKLNKTKQKNKENKKEKIIESDEVINKKIQDEDLKNAFYDFIKMRDAIKKPLTTRGLELAIDRVNKLSNDKEEQLLIINKSIMNNWQGLFALNDEDKKQLEKQKEYKTIDITDEEYLKQTQERGKKYV